MMNTNKTTYKDSPLGKIPGDWEVKRLGEICTTFKSGYGITSEEINAIGEYAVYGGNGLRGYTNKFTHEGNYFLIGRQGALCGNIVSVIGRNYISEHAIAVQTNDKNYNSFLAYKLDFLNLNRLSESSAQPGLSVEKLIRIKITLPPLPEQKAIAHVLGLIDSAINTNNQLVAKKELQKKWLMQVLLTREKRLKGFGSEWEEHKISQLGQIVTGNTPSMSKPEYYGDKYCWATAFDFKGVYIDETDIKLSEEGKNVARIVPRGSILVTCIASIGKNAIANVEMAFNQQINAIVPNENFYSEFIYYMIENSLHKLKEVAGAGAVTIINKSNFETIKLKFPLIEEQTAIARVLQTADKEILLLKTKTERLREQKKGLMQVLLTGKKRLAI